MGKIERINLRGISRSPSDRMLTDGGCAESLNVQLDHNEIVPMPKPDDITDDVIGDDDSYTVALYIHKGTYYSNYIYGYWTRAHIYYLCARVNGVRVDLKIFSFGQGDTTTGHPEVTSVGNTLVASFAGSMWYFLFKDGEYKTLGDQIPIPKIRFYMKTGSIRTVPSVPYGSVSIADANTERTTMGYLYDRADFDPSGWSTQARSYKVVRDVHRSVISKIWDRVSTVTKSYGEDSKCVLPVFVRYAVRLYDGSLYACSTPILLGADLNKYLAIRLYSQYIGGKVYAMDDTGALKETYAYDVAARVEMPDPFRIVADFTYNELSGSDWEDIVSGIDMFISTPIFPMLNPDTISVSYPTHGDSEPFPDGGYDSYHAEAEMDPINFSEKPDKLLQQHPNTFLVKSWTLDELSNASEIELTNLNYSSDWISTQEVMVETYNSIHKTTGFKLESYNKRLLLNGYKTELYEGYPFYNATRLSSVSGSSKYTFVWHIRVDGEEKTVITKDINGNAYISSGMPAGAFYESFIGWISYPDARAYKLDIYTEGTLEGEPVTLVKTCNAKSFTDINVSYVFFGFGETISGWDGIYSGGTLTEDSTVVVDDSICLSASSNPFIFPASGVIDFDNSNILGTAMVTKALSQGQFGQFPLYVFTSTGIWAIGLNSEGDFVSKHAVSRDVAMEGTIAPIDQAIVFTTKKGVMMMSGSDIQNISPNMNGKHYILEADPATLLTQNSHAGLVMASQNAETFQSFMETAKAVYDYAGERLVFGSEDYGKYMYVYRLSTGTWHKMTLIEGNGSPLYNFSVVRALNSYPESVMSLFTNTGSMVVNLSKVLIQDGTDDNAMEEGLIATRPIDFGLPDIYKSVTRVKIRGEVDRSNNHSPFKYILLGSNDGVNWAMLHSLRGPSFKLFRLIILTTLNSTERISYAEIEYEPRFTNKIR